MPPEAASHSHTPAPPLNPSLPHVAALERCVRLAVAVNTPHSTNE